MNEVSSDRPVRSRAKSVVAGSVILIALFLAPTQACAQGSYLRAVQNGDCLTVEYKYSKLILHSYSCFDGGVDYLELYHVSKGVYEIKIGNSGGCLAFNGVTVSEDTCGSQDTAWSANTLAGEPGIQIGVGGFCLARGTTALDLDACNAQTPEEIWYY